MMDMELRIPKADMAARTIYDFKRLEQKHFLLLPCEIQEERETIRMTFHLNGFHSLKDLKESEKAVRIACLWQIAELGDLYERLDFSLEPENLYCDISGRVRVRKRDIIPVIYKSREQQFLKQYKALVGCMMEGLCSYEDYLAGGAEIMSLQSVPAGLLETETVQEVKELLGEFYERIQKKEKKDMIRMERKKYERMRIYSIASALLLMLYTAAVLCGLVWYQP